MTVQLLSPIDNVAVRERVTLDKLGDNLCTLSVISRSNEGMKSRVTEHKKTMLLVL